MNESNETEFETDLNVKFSKSKNEQFHCLA